MVLAIVSGLTPLRKGDEMLALAVESWALLGLWAVVIAAGFVYVSRGE